MNIDSDDSVTAFVRVENLQDEEYINSNYLLFCTRNGIVKKTLLEAYSRPRQNGVIAITLRDDDQVISVRLTDGKQHVILANSNGRAIRFDEEDVRPMGRTATGVKGITLDDDGEDAVIGMICMTPESENTILVVSEQGYGKRTMLNDEDGEPVYRITRRGGKGVKTINITEKTGKLVAIKSVTDDNDLMIINKSGITIRVKISDIRIMGRVTQGVRLINLEKRNDEIASVCKVNAEDNGEENDAVNVEEYESGEDRDNVEAEMGSDVNTDENVH